MPAWAKTDIPATRNTATRFCAAVVLCLVTALPAVATVYNSRNPENTENVANPWTEDVTANVGIVEKVNSPVPADLSLIDENGKPVKLGSFFEEGRPVVMNLGYSRCPSICPAMRMQLVNTLADTDLTLGDDFIVLNISIDPEESHEVSASMRAGTLKDLEEKGVAASEDGWRFLTADQDTIEALTDAIGYRYLYIKPQNEYGHPGVLVLADGEGVIRRYLSGTAYSGRTLKLSIVETSQGKVGSLFDQAFVTCFVWDAEANNYTATATFIMTLGGGVTIVFVIGLVLAGFAYEKRKRELNDNSPSNRPPSVGQPTPA